MITTESLIAAVIKNEHGWAVAEQFEATFNGEAFEEQNYNALKYIERTVRDVFNSDILNIEANDELEDYLVELGDYLKETK